MKQLTTILFVLTISVNYTSGQRTDDIFWFRDKLKLNARVDDGGKQEYALKIEDCNMALASTATVQMPGGADVVQIVYGVRLKDIFLIQTQTNNRDCRFKIRTKQEIISRKWLQANHEDNTDEILVLLNKDAIENGDFEKIILLLTKMVQSCGGTVSRQEY